jgi:hypothetical protein
MRAYSSIPVLLSVVLAATACDTSPVGISDSGGAVLLAVAPSAATIRGGGTIQLSLSAHEGNGQATVIGDQPGTLPCPINPAAPEFLQKSCVAQ